MKQVIHILLSITLLPVITYAQGSGERGGFSLAGKYASQQTADSSLLIPDSSLLTTKRIHAYHLTPFGDRIEAPMDTNRLNTANSTLMEGHGVAMAYTGNIASPSQSRIFFEREESRDFIFANVYDYYIITPQNATFYDTKTPYTNALYTRAGSTEKREEQLKVFITSNFGKKINVGSDFDYIYSRGHYNSNGNKLINYRVFGNYRSDRYEAYAYLRNFNMVNRENGGLLDDRYITHPDDMTDGGMERDSKAFPTKFSDTWNRTRSKNIFLTHRYNLGFYREMTDEELEELRKKEEKQEQLAQQQASEIDPDGNNQLPESEKEEKIDIHEEEVFVPVSSIIHTFEYEDYRRRFISYDKKGLDSCYNNRAYFPSNDTINDISSSRVIKNTVALSLREGFHDWAKFGVSAFVRFENKNFALQDSVLTADSSALKGITERESAVYIGGELSKRRGKLLTYQGRGELCIVGKEHIGEFRLSGDIQTKFKLFGKDAYIQADGYITNTTPAFFQRRYQSHYFWWNKDLKKTRNTYFGGTITVDQTRTKISAGIKNIENLIYFDTIGYPAQSDKNIQVAAVRLKQDFRYRALGWENEVIFQKSSDESILPLPKISAYSNLFLTFKYAKVLTIQIGADVHYHSAYYSPIYDPAVQQFINQEKIKIGDYPLMNAYANFHLKQARFFVMGYNLSSLFIDNPQSFSLPHYPINPMVVKLGVAVTFNN